MKVADLPTGSHRAVEIHGSGAPGALERSVTWCAPTESIDPSPYLTSGAVVLTSGMALNVVDFRIWDAYVERLAAVPVAALAFGIGPAHAALPQGLVQACELHGVPLIVIPPEVPFIHLQRHIQDTLASERYEATRRGSELAEQCTRIAAMHGTLDDVLNAISTTMRARVSIEDSTGALLLAAGEAPEVATRTECTLPGGEDERFRMVIEEARPTAGVPTLLGPVAAVVSMQLSTMLGSAGVEHSRNAGRLTEAIFTRESVPSDELLALARDADLDPFEPIGLLVLQTADSRSTSHLRATSWRARVILAAEFPVVRYVESAELATILVQGPTLDHRALVRATRTAVGGRLAISAVTALAENASELGLNLRLSRRRLGTPGLTAAPALDLEAVVDSIRHPGAISMARRLLEPLVRDDDDTLLRTLEVYLRLSGATPAVCRELFIHRNTLAYRLRKIETLIGVDLQDGLTRATWLIALRLR